MTALPRHRLGRTGLEVTELCFGTSPLASMAGLYGYEVDDERAVATPLAAFSSPIRFLDTSDGYRANGASERRGGVGTPPPGGGADGVLRLPKADPAPRRGH